MPFPVGTYAKGDCEEEMSVYQTIFDLGLPGSDEKPFVYHGSHIVPNRRNRERGGSIGLGGIRVFVTRNGDDSKLDSHDWLPYLRVSVGNQTVMLEKEQVAELRDRLNGWLENTQRSRP